MLYQCEPVHKFWTEAVAPTIAKVLNLTGTVDATKLLLGIGLWGKDPLDGRGKEEPKYRAARALVAAARATVVEVVEKDVSST